MTEKEKFCKGLTVLIDTREKQNKHITDTFDTEKIPYEVKKLHFGDYSFRMNSGEDFSLSCIVERKSNINELWGNITKDRERFEKELKGIYSMTGSAVLLIECCPSRQFLRKFIIPDWQMKQQGRKVSNIGSLIDSTLRAWESCNRYCLQVHCLNGQEETATELLNIFYYHYKNFSDMKKPLRNE